LSGCGARLLTSYSYSKEVSIVLKRIVTEKDDCVIALVPSGLRDAYLRIIRKTDWRDNRPSGHTKQHFCDGSLSTISTSRRIVKELTEAEKALYRKEIKEDVTFFSKSYERADLRVDISGLGAECSAEMIAGLLAAFGSAGRT